MFDVRGFGRVWVGLGHLFGGLGWAGSMKIDPRTTMALQGWNFFLTKSRFVCFTLLMPDTKLRPTSVHPLATAELHMHGVIVMTFPFSNVNILYSVSEMPVWKDKQ